MDMVWAAILIVVAGQGGPSAIVRPAERRLAVPEATWSPHQEPTYRFAPEYRPGRRHSNAALGLAEGDACEVEDDESRSIQPDLLGFDPAGWLSWTPPHSTRASGRLPLLVTASPAPLHLRC